jgi:diguanylate cyclase (GGDEF)-like protein
MNLHMSNKEWRRLVQHISNGVAVLYPSPWRIAWSNDALADWLAIPANDLAGALLENLEAVPWRARLIAQLSELRTTLEQGQDHAETLVQAGDERCHIKLLDLSSAAAPVYALVVQRPPASHSHVAELHTRLDPLTNLPDRSFLLARMETLLQGDRIGDRAFAVLFIDLDNFKQANDRFGHIAGDRILRSAADRLRHCVRENDHVVRFGGDEFVVLLEGVVDRADVEPVIERIGQAFREPFDLANESIKLSLSIGVAVASPFHHSPEDVLSAADSDMYAVKRAGN